MENNKIITTKQPKYPRIKQTEEQKKVYHRWYYQKHFKLMKQGYSMADASEMLKKDE